MRHKWLLSRLLWVAAMFIACVTIAASVAAEDRIYNPPQRDLWNFTLRIENMTGHEIHVRILEQAVALREVTISGETVGPTRMPDGQPFLNVDGTPLPDHFNLRSVPLPLHESTKSLRVEETEYLHIVKSFDVSTFTSHPEADFRLRVGGEHNLTLTQDFLLGDPEDSLEDRVQARRQCPAWKFVLINKSGKPITLHVSVDGRPIFEKHLDASLPPSATPKTQDCPGHRCPDAPAFLVTAPVPVTAQSLLVEETESLKSSQTFDVHVWATEFMGYTLEVNPDRMRLEPDFPAWAYGIEHMP